MNGRAASWLVGWPLLAAALAGYGLLFAGFYPPLPGIEDEIGFLNQALVWSRGAVSAEGAGWPRLTDFVEVRGRHVPWRNPGRSLLALPALLLGGPGAAFWTGAILHAITVMAAGWLLSREGANPAWAVLVLAHPTLALYSRTVTADGSAGCFLLLALAGLRTARHPGAWSGFWLGAAVACRYQAVVIVPFFLAAIGSMSALPSPRRTAAAALAVAAAWGVALLGYNGAVLDALCGPTGQGYFTLSAVPSHLLHYGVALALIWPGMLAAPVLDRSALRWPIRAICGPLLLLLLPYYFHDRRDSWAETLVVGQRLLQPALPVWIVAFVLVLTRRGEVEGDEPPGLSRRCARTAGINPAARPWVAIGVTGGLLIMVGLLFHRHQHHLEELATVRDEVAAIVPPGSLIIANATLEKLFGLPEEDGPRYRFLAYHYFDTPLDHAATLGAEKRPWFVALLLKSPADEHPATLRRYQDRFGLVRLPTRHPQLRFYRAAP